MVELATDRLVLREIRSSDVGALAGYQRDPRYLEYYTRPPDTKQIVELAQSWATESPRINYQLIITLDRGERTIGCAGLRQADHPFGEAEVGIELCPDYWGHGYAREALSALRDFAQDTLALQQLYALTTPNNQRAHRLFESAGFSQTEQCKKRACFSLRLQ